MRIILAIVIVVFISSCSVYNPFRKYQFNYRSIRSIDIISKRDTTYFQHITQKDSIKTIVKSYINRSHYELIIKPRGVYNLNINFTDDTHKQISTAANFIITEKGAFVIKRSLETYLDATNKHISN